jgi:hypothetical protein
MPASRSKTAQAHGPTFVFKGRIKKLKSATMKDLPVDALTVVVTVNQVIEAPAALAEYTGQDITVQLSRRQQVRVGQEFIFHTTSWIFGESIAVRSLAEEPVTRSRAAVLSAAAVDPVERRAQRQKRVHFDEADLVVSGKVVAVRLPAGDTQRSRAVKSRAISPASSIQAPRGPVSEHDPKWREAVVEVDEVHKGSHKKKQVVVRFPASKDVMWYGAPKFHPGQQGFFMLRKPKTEKPKVKRSRKRPGPRDLAESAVAEPEVESGEAYVALDPTDFQPYSEPGGVKTIIESESAKPKG